MGRRARTVAEPQRNQRRLARVEQRQGEGREQVRQVPPDRDSPGVHRIGPLGSALPQQQIEQLLDICQPPVVVEAGEILVVAEAPANLRRPEPGFERLFVRGASKEIRERCIALRRRGDDRPVRDQSAQHCWLALRHDLALEPLPVDVRIFGDWPHGARLAVPQPLG